MEVQDIFEDLQDPGPIPESGDNAFKIAIRKTGFILSRGGKHTVRAPCFSPIGTEGRGSVYGSFGTSLNDILRDELIEKLTDFELKRKLLEQRNITLEEALDKARALEAACRQASNMTTSPPLADGNSINVVKERQRMANDERRKCYNCGREGHLARDRNCPARGKK